MRVIFRAIVLAGLTMILSGCMASYFLVTAPYEYIARYKPDQYYSFSLKVNNGDETLNFNASIFCEHQIVFSAANGWTDSYQSVTTDIVFVDNTQQKEWQLQGVRCPQAEKNEKFLGMFRKLKDGSVSYLAWLDADMKTFTIQGRMDAKAKYHLYKESSSIFSGYPYPREPYAYWLIKPSVVYSELMRQTEPVILGGKPGRCGPDSARKILKGISAREISRRKDSSYIQRGFLDFDGEIWTLGQPAIGNRYVDVYRKIESVPFNREKACLTLRYGGSDYLMALDEYLYDPVKGLVIGISAASHSDMERSMYINSIVPCRSDLPKEELDMAEGIPDFREIKRLWYEKRETKKSENDSMTSVLMMNVKGETQCLQLPSGVYYGPGW